MAPLYFSDDNLVSAARVQYRRSAFSKHWSSRHGVDDLHSPRHMPTVEELRRWRSGLCIPDAIIPVEVAATRDGLEKRLLLSEEPLRRNGIVRKSAVLTGKSDLRQPVRGAGVLENADNADDALRLRRESQRLAKLLTQANLIGGLRSRGVSQFIGTRNSTGTRRTRPIPKRAPSKATRLEPFNTEHVKHSARIQSQPLRHPDQRISISNGPFKPVRSASFLQPVTVPLIIAVSVASMGLTGVAFIYYKENEQVVTSLARRARTVNHIMDGPSNGGLLIAE